MDKLIKLINIDNQEILVDEIVSQENYQERSYMYHLQIDLYKLQDINAEYKEYDLDNNGNVIIPVIPTEPTE